MARTSKGPTVGRRTTVRRLIGGLTLLLVLFQAGCFTYLPLQSELPQSPEVRVLLNDRGRVAVADGVGSGVDWIEGAMAGADSATVRLRVSRVVYIRGGSSIWTGEEVVVPRDGVMGFQGREFSKAKSWALFGVTVAALTWFVLNVNLDLFGDEKDDRCTGTNCGPNTEVRW